MPLPTTIEPWSCPTCSTRVTSAFCPGCGERPLGPPDYTVKGLLMQLAKAVGGLDGRLLRSLRLLLASPGALTLAYVQGRRKPLVGPFQLFFLANFVFFITQSLTHTKIFSSTLYSHLHQQDWSELAQRLVARRLAVTHDTLAHYAPLFDQAVVLYAKSLVILMAVPFAALLPVLFYTRHKPFGVHMAFALHFYAFVLLLFCAALAAIGGSMLLGGPGLESPLVDTIVTSVDLIICAVYLYLAVGRVYGGPPALRAAQAIGLAVAVGAIVLGYRFVILLITLALT